MCMEIRKGPMIQIRENPWIPEEAIFWMDSYLNKERTVLEFGAGSSTLWFAKRVKHVVSYENKEQWFSAIVAEMARLKFSNVDLRLDVTYPAVGPKNINGQFDFVLIDGRGRVKCAQTSYELVKPGGWVGLDNSWRERYLKIHILFNRLGWRRRDIFDYYMPEHKLGTFTLWRKPPNFQLPKETPNLKHEHEIDFLASLLTEKSRVLEFGSGCSTIWFAKHVAKVVTCEDKEHWRDAVIQRLKDLNLENTTLFYLPYYYKNFRWLQEPFDLVYVDSYSSATSPIYLCVENNFKYVKPGGYIVFGNRRTIDSMKAKELMKRLGWQKFEIPEPFQKCYWKRPK